VTSVWKPDTRKWRPGAGEERPGKAGPGGGSARAASWASNGHCPPLEFGPRAESVV
jgi:hypothetical protein